VEEVEEVEEEERGVGRSREEEGGGRLRGILRVGSGTEQVQLN